jgi:hypothetical protein
MMCCVESLDLGLDVKSCLKSFEISGLPELWELKYINLITPVIVFCTYVLIIWSVVLQDACYMQMMPPSLLTPSH